MKNIWNKMEKLPKIKVENKVDKTKMNKCLNEKIKEAEIRRAIGKLKKDKAPGEDMIPNEVWIAVEKRGVGEITEVLE